MTKSRFNLRNVIAGAICLAGVVMFSGCGGGNGSSGAGGKSNKFFDDLPKIYIDYNAQEKALEEKGKAAIVAEDKDAYAKAVKASEELQAKFEEYKKAGWEKIAGREIPFSFSPAAQELELIKNIDITSAKLGEGDSKGNVVFTVKAKNDISSKLLDKGGFLFCKFVAADGSALYTGSFSFNPAKNYTAGQSMTYYDVNPSIMIIDSVALLSDFAKIEFVTQQEYDAAKAEIREKNK